MSRLLFLASGPSYAYTDLSNRSILDGLPGSVTVLANAAVAPAFEGVSAEVHIVRWRDFSSVEKTVLSMHAQQPFTAVVTIDERTMEPAARLRDLLNLPGLRADQVPRYRDKLTMKRVLAEGGVRVPAFAACEDRPTVEGLLRRHGRIAIKPIDGVGSVGVSFADSHKDVAEWYAEHAGETEQFEAEEFIAGQMHQVDAMVQGAKAVHTSVACTLPGLGCIEFSSGAPLARVLLDDSPLRRQLVEFSDRVIRVLGLQDGVTHLECFVTPDGEPVVCEVAARPAGGGSQQMYEAQTGINFARAAVLLALGCEGDMRPNPTKSTVGMVAFRAAHPARIQRIAAIREFPEPWIRYGRIDYEEGSLVTSAVHSNDYMGFFVFCAEDRMSFDGRLAELRARFDSRLELAPL